MRDVGAIKKRGRERRTLTWLGMATVERRPVVEKISGEVAAHNLVCIVV